MAFAVIAACGGGGSGTSSSPPPSATQTRTLAPTATATSTTVPTLTATARLTATSTHTASPSATATATQIPSASPSSTPTTLPTSTPTETATLPPTSTATLVPTPLLGPIVTAFGIADGVGTVNVPNGMDEQGRQIFVPVSKAGFILFVEGRSGPSHLPVGTQLFNSKPGDPTQQPDLQLESSNDLGNPTKAVCDRAFPTLGGVPATTPPDFSDTQPVSDALNDVSCRFKVFAQADYACTQDAGGNLMFASSSSTIQFCTLVDDALTFPSGDTVLTVRLRDVGGAAGPSVQIVIRISGS